MPEMGLPVMLRTLSMPAAWRLTLLCRCCHSEPQITDTSDRQIEPCVQLSVQHVTVNAATQL